MRSGEDQVPFVFEWRTFPRFVAVNLVSMQGHSLTPRTQNNIVQKLSRDAPGETKKEARHSSEDDPSGISNPPAESDSVQDYARCFGHIMPGWFPALHGIARLSYARRLHRLLLGPTT